MKIQLNKNKSIGKVLYIIEGNRTEPFILEKIFTKIFDYQLEEILREKGYSALNSKINPTSQIFVINAEQSNIKFIDKDNEFLNNVFIELIEKYDFNVDSSAIYYLFDRDPASNKNVEFIKSLLQTLKNARDNEGYNRQGLLLLSYPSIESFTLSNFCKNSFNEKFRLGSHLKQYLHDQKINQYNITDDSLAFATEELFNALKQMDIFDFDIDNFGEYNMKIFDYEEDIYSNEKLYNALSLLCISLIDLNLIEVDFSS